MVRDLLEAFVSHFPVSEQLELVARIQSKTRHVFKSAVFEILLHEGLLRQGFELESHPKLPHTASRPDFLVSCPSGSFYLEAVLASERGVLDPGSQLRIDATLDGLASIPHPNFLVFADYRGVPSTQPSVSKLRTEVMKWLDSLSPDECIDDVARPEFRWRHEDWELSLEAVPIKADRRGKGQRLLAGHSGGGGWRDGWTSIRDAVKYKTQKYGNLDKPFLIAVNYGSVFLNGIDERQALFGEEQITVSIVNPEAEPRLTRIPNGAWYGNKGPTGRRTSGAWIFKGLNVYNAATCKQSIYLNPWAKDELPECLRIFPHCFVSADQLVEKEGVDYGNALGLERGWLDD